MFGTTQAVPARLGRAAHCHFDALCGQACQGDLGGASRRRDDSREQQPGMGTPVTERKSVV